MMVKHCTKKTNKSIYKKNKKIKTSLLMMIQIGIPPVFIEPCPRNVLWNGNQKIRAIFQLLTRSQGDNDDGHEESGVAKDAGGKEKKG